MANKLLGQHFLKNHSVIKKIVDAVTIQRGDAVIEIGPGHGELTGDLLAKCREAGATLIAIEKDPALANALTKKFSGVAVVQKDILKFLGSPTEMPTGRRIFIGNLPYYLTGKLLRVISELKEKPAECIFMVQKEVAERMMAQPPKMNRLAASVQYWAKLNVVANVPKDDFSPKPEVDSTVVRFLTIQSDTKEEYYNAVRALFAQPRKTILNNLLAVGLERDAVNTALDSLTLSPSLRPQDLSIESISAIAKALF